MMLAYNLPTVPAVGHTTLPDQLPVSYEMGM